MSATTIVGWVDFQETQQKVMVVGLRYRLTQPTAKIVRENLEGCRLDLVSAREWEQERARCPFHKTTKLQNYKTTKLQNY
ncbi:MAG: hypothetical protein SWX82_23845 [Cyanobacteriota bacterium]|nr:hypothetical protein [Cyanobacteriota bacterium]